MENETQPVNQSATLDPPGTIAVVGAGPLGIEAALYGRYLGYDVTLFESAGVADSMASRRDEAIPMMPDRCVSPLALAALTAQGGERGPTRLPVTIGEWIDQVWLPLTQTDLLRGRLRCPARVRAIGWADDAEPPVEATPAEPRESGEEFEDSVPPDFQLAFDDGPKLDFEAVILATGTQPAGGDSRAIDCSISLPADYFFQVGGRDSGDAEADFWGGLKQIVAVYASLGGRVDLDLYRPARG